MSRAARRRAEREATKAPPKLYVSKAESQVAFHEGCHAVAYIRLKLPLASTDIIRRTFDPGGRRMPKGIYSQGYTRLTEGTGRAWQAALPDPKAKENLKRFAVATGAGVVAEMMMGEDPNGPGCGDDVAQLCMLARVLGITEDEEVDAWINERVNEASELLANDGDAIDLVAGALLEHRSLTGDEVRGLLRQAQQ
jgi:hypothetical protein